MRCRIGAILVGALVGVSLTFGTMGSGVAAEKVRFIMDWIYSGKHTPFLVARDKGYWKKAGVDVKVLQGRGSGKSAAWVDTKKVEYSFGDFLTMIKAVSKGAKNVAVGAVHVYQTGGYIFFEETGIKTPKDLEGKRYGGPPADFGRTLMPAMAAASGFDMKKIIFKTMKPAVRTPALFEGKIDFIAGTRGSSIPRMRIHAKRKGRKISYLYFKDMGLKSYGHVIQVHRDRIRNKPREVRAVVGGLFDAFAWTINHPKEALDIYMKANPTKDREIQEIQLGEAIEDVQDPEVKHKGLGYMKESRVKESVAIANKYFKLSPKVDYKVTYTNQFIRPNPGL